MQILEEMIFLNQKEKAFLVCKIIESDSKLEHVWWNFIRTGIGGVCARPHSHMKLCTSIAKFLKAIKMVDGPLFFRPSIMTIRPRQYCPRACLLVCLTYLATAIASTTIATRTCLSSIFDMSTFSLSHETQINVK